MKTRYYLKIGLYEDYATDDNFFKKVIVLLEKSSRKERRTGKKDSLYEYRIKRAESVESLVKIIKENNQNWEIYKPSMLFSLLAEVGLKVKTVSGVISDISDIVWSLNDLSDELKILVG